MTTAPTVSEAREKEITRLATIEECAALAESFSTTKHIAHDVFHRKFPKKSELKDAIAEAIRALSQSPSTSGAMPSVEDMARAAKAVRAERNNSITPVGEGTDYDMRLAKAAILALFPTADGQATKSGGVE